MDCLLLHITISRVCWLPHQGSLLGHVTSSQPTTAHLVPPLPLPVHGAALDVVELGPLSHPKPVLSPLGLQGKHNVKNNLGTILLFKISWSLVLGDAIDNRYVTVCNGMQAPGPPTVPGTRLTHARRDDVTRAPGCRARAEWAHLAKVVQCWAGSGSI